MKRMAPGAGLVAVTFAWICLASPAAVAQPPNVLLILTDDQGYGDIGSHGNPIVRTPILDRLAEDGARFDRFFVSPVCAPTRAALLTGRYPLRTGVQGVTRGFENMRARETTIAELLGENGYSTGIFGKWHNGRHAPLHPNGQGFDEFVGFCGGHWNTYFDPPLEHNGHEIRRRGYIADVFTDEAIAFIRNHREQPWFCYVAYNTPHSPWRVPQPFWQNYEGLGLDVRAHCAYAMVENLDVNTGRLLEALDELELTERTIVIFMTDNGANSNRYNAGMRGRKGSVDEGGSRVPCFVRYPGVVAPGTVIEPISAHIDILPTLLEWCDIPVPSGLRLDGQSLVPLLIGETDGSSFANRMLFTDRWVATVPDRPARGAVRTQRWRAVLANEQWRLYDMQSDPGQTRDVSSDHGEVVQHLTAAYDQWLAEVAADISADEPPPIPVGHPGQDRVFLPANESTLHPGHGQGIAYTGDGTSGFANCWIHEWTDPEAYPEWTVDAAAAGRYRVRIEYTCRREDVGVQLELVAGDQSRRTVVPRAFDPPLLDKPDHVFSRNYEDKTGWATLNAGEITLSPGTTRVRVRLADLPGTQGVDLRGVRLDRIEDEAGGPAPGPPQAVDRISRSSSQ